MERGKKVGIIFDMDGTLWDSAKNVAVSWTKVLSNYPDAKVISEQDVKNVMGLTMTAIADIFFPGMESSLKEKIMDECMVYENVYLKEHGGRLYPKLEATLKKLNEDGWPLYILSNAQSGYIEAFLDYYNLGNYFEDFTCFGDTNLPKGPNMRRLAEKNSLDAFYYVGDIQGDYESTKEAGGHFIHARYGFGKISDQVHAIDSFDQLPGLMKELEQEIIPNFFQKNKQAARDI